MKKLLLSLCLALFIAAPAMAAINSEDAAQHVGETQTVCGTVAQVAYLSKGVAINIGAQYPLQHINGFVWNGKAVNVNAGVGGFDNLIGKDICMSGRIVLYKGRPEIIINTPGQISIQ